MGLGREVDLSDSHTPNDLGCDGQVAVLAWLHDDRSRLVLSRQDHVRNSHGQKRPRNCHLSELFAFHACGCLAVSRVTDLVVHLRGVHIGHTSFRP
jgi:hypothetical protein